MCWVNGLAEESLVSLMDFRLTGVLGRREAEAHPKAQNMPVKFKAWGNMESLERLRNKKMKLNSIPQGPWPLQCIDHGLT